MRVWYNLVEISVINSTLGDRRFRGTLGWNYHSPSMYLTEDRSVIKCFTVSYGQAYDRRLEGTLLVDLWQKASRNLRVSIWPDAS
jgi:hypothetical protein